MGATGDTERARVRLDPPTLHAPRGDTVAAVTLATGITAATWGGAFAPWLGALATAVGIAMGGVGIVGGLAAIAYPWQRLRVHDLRVTRRIARLRGGTPQPIAVAHTGLVHVRGRVHVLAQVPLPHTGEPGAAFVSRSRIQTRCTCTETCAATYRAIRTEWATGRFAVVDESGVTVVDGGVVDLWPRGKSFSTEGELVLRHGELIDVLGRARPVDAPDVATLAPSTYRARSQATELVGSVEHPVSILLPT